MVESSNPEPSELQLAAEFGSWRYEDWVSLVAQRLKRGDLEQLVTRTHDGLQIQPLYRRAENAEPIAGRGGAQPWQIMQRVDHPDPAMAMELTRHEFEAGASGFLVVFCGAIGARGFGVPWEPTLAGLVAEMLGPTGAAIELDLSPPAKHELDLIARFAKKNGVHPDATQLRFGFDPLGTTAINGGSLAPWVKTVPCLARLVQELAGQGFRGPFFAADSRVIHDAGGAAADELAFALASALAYLRALEATGTPVAQARHLLFFRLSADADQFVTMAKFRALRRLWARAEEAIGIDPKPAFVSAETAWRMMTRRDPWVNILRTTVAAFAAGLAGANAVSVLPFTAAIGLPDRFARRIARNTQLILIEECHLAKVSDPAAGSGAIEALTDQLCRQAWKALQAIERAGGLALALESGLIQAKVAEVRQARLKAVASRRDVFTGTSAFADLAETPVAVLKAFRPSTGAGFPVSFPPLLPHRLAAPFEALRDASDQILAKTGARPKIFLANLGPVSAFSEAASFARNFFEIGGIEAVTSKEGVLPAGTLPSPQRSDEAPPTDLAALAAGFCSSGAGLACLCSSQQIYAAEAPAAAQALLSAGAKHIYLAGRPAGQEGALNDWTIKTFIYPGCDALATLRAAHDMLARG
jgi:methylmalonyl-CoA mutase